MTKARDNANGGLGLILIKPSSVVNGTDNGKGTISFSNQTSVSLNNVFNSTYSNYRIVFHATGASSNSTITFRLRANGSDATANNYYRAGVFNYSNSSSFIALNAQGTSFTVGDVLSAAPNRSYLTIEASQPNNAVETVFTFFMHGQNSTSSYAFQGSGLQDSYVAYDGFTFNFTASSSGVISVYGYNK